MSEHDITTSEGAHAFLKMHGIDAAEECAKGMELLSKIWPGGEAAFWKSQYEVKSKQATDTLAVIDGRIEELRKEYESINETVPKSRAHVEQLTSTQSGISHRVNELQRFKALLK